MIRSLVAASLLVLAASPYAHAQALKILSFTGEIQFKVGDKLTSVVAGGRPVAIPPGAEVTVVSGEAVFQSGDTAIKTGKGSSFSYNTGAGGALQIAATGDASSLTITAGKSVATIKSGSSVAVDTAGRGATITVIEGSAVVSVAGGPPRQLAAGESVSDQTARPQVARAEERKVSDDSGDEEGDLPPPPPPPSSSPNPQQETGTETSETSPSTP